LNRYAEWIRERLPQYREMRALWKETQGWMIYSDGLENGASIGVRRKMSKDFRSRREVAEGVKAMDKKLRLQNPLDPDTNRG
jgi:hypothetical protein